MSPSDAAICIECSQPTVSGKCVNVECPRAHQQASQFAGRTTAKAGVASGAVSGTPNAWRASGGVD